MAKLKITGGKKLYHFNLLSTWCVSNPIPYVFEYKNYTLPIANRILILLESAAPPPTLTGYVYFWMINLGDARTQSPPTKNCAPEAPTFGEIAGFNRTKCNARSPPGGTALMITVPSVPGKLIFPASNHIIYKDIILVLVGTLKNTPTHGWLRSVLISRNNLSCLTQPARNLYELQNRVKLCT